jgi:hypothetical protein
VAIVFGFKFQKLRTSDNCRFAKDFTTAQLLSNPDKLD